MMDGKHLILGACLLGVVLTTTSASAQSRSFNGRGQQVSPLFKLDEGLTVFKLKHSGKHNFAVRLLDQDGNFVELLVNAIGPFDGAKAVRISRTGRHLLDISADGQWTVSYGPPANTATSDKSVFKVESAAAQ